MQKYIDIVWNSYVGYFNYLMSEVLHPSFHNYFYWLVGLSALVWILEIVFPWRLNQPKIRKDFWLDAFYMFFNFFIFSLIIYNAVSNVFVQFFDDFLKLLGVENLVAIQGEGYWFTVNPILDLRIGKDTESKSSNTFVNTRGVKVDGGLGEQLTFSTSIFESQGRFADYYNNYAESIKPSG